MLETIARALCRQYEIDDGFSPEQADKAAEGEMYRNFLPAARAVLRAMREPPLEMWIDEDMSDRRNWNCQMCGGPKENWERIIDAALAPTK